MIGKLLKKIEIKDIDVFVYTLNKEAYRSLPEPEYDIEINNLSKKKTQFKLLKNKQVVHRSNLFEKVFLLGLIKKKGPVIGDCFTDEAFRGLSLYPKMIHFISKRCLFNQNIKEVFIIVDTVNKPSIKGIEKAAYVKHAHINTKRWLWFYYKTTIKYYNN
ncbi:hypothetical protein [Hanstruepera marina]|uniref:hypothetical protein n=1 Tax=Hanstruepera marina TaxID=2873265 RepID=UPI001CA789FC|nr:hypothetical protein [Hanstruepera marina]